MRRYFNIVESGKTATVYLYGNIGRFEEDINAESISKELADCAKRGKKINLRINSYGGEVYEGIAIFNAIKSCEADIEIFIDGIAASMAGVVAMCGRPVKMSKYARLMIHSVSGGCYGNTEEMKKCIAEMSALEDSLCDIFATKMKAEKESIRTQFFDGKDHYLTGEEAVKMGLVDEIYETKERPKDDKVDSVYSLFNQVLNNNKKTMKYEELKKRTRFADCATDESVEARISEMEVLLDSTAEENRNMKARLEAFENAEKEANEAHIKTILDEAIAEHKFGEDKRETFKSLLVADFDNGVKAIDAIEAKKKVTVPGNQGEESPWEKRMKEIKERSRY